MAIAGPNHIARRKPARSVLVPRLASLEVFHSSICFFVQSIRVTVRRIASALMYAS